MMSRDELRNELGAARKKGKVDWMMQLVYKDIDAADLLRITFDPEQTIAFRAAWMLEYVTLERPELFSVIRNRFVEQYPLQANPSCQRHYTKIMMGMCAGKGNGLKPEEEETVIEATFGWLIDQATPVAVQVNCMDILHYLSRKHDWIADELVQQIGFLMKNGTAALQSRGKRILQKLKK